ncbi:MAG: DinB family protein, partial [candidate division NC10 bacterium]
MNPYAKFLEHRDPLAGAAATPAKIVSLIRGLTPRELARRPAPGKWSIQEIIRHLADTEMV